MNNPLRACSVLLSILVCACSSAGDGGDTAFRNEVQQFLDRYNQRFQELYRESNQAQWLSQTHIVDGDETNTKRTRAAEEALAAFTGSVENIELSRAYLKRRRELSPLQAKELDVILFKAGGNPQTVPDLVKQRIKAETEQVERLYGFKFSFEGREVTPNEIDELLRTERDLERRQKVWEASKEVGKTLRDGLVRLRGLRNDTVIALGYRDFFSYMAAEYGLSGNELAQKVDEINRELRPLFTELHTFARYQLAERFAQPVPDLIPAHWLPNRWGQDWSSLVDVEGYDLNGALKEKPARWIVEQAERFYVGLGFEPLPATFWEQSSLFPLPLDAGYKKNNHASAWHMDLDRDVRSLMSVEPNSEWYETAHHELGHIYYYLTYSNPKVPFVLRAGANRAYHEAMGSLIGLAAMQPRFVAASGLATEGQKLDPMQLMLKEALNYVVFIPWSAGTMFHFEQQLYNRNLSAEHFNQRWWELTAKYQGVAPPTPRDERYCDAATKTHINDDPAAYYDYALSYVLLFQLHDHIARQILSEDPHDTNYFGRKEVGNFLKSIMKSGASADWRLLLREKTGSDISARAMVDYFEPLKRWLQEQNKGRKPTLPPL